MDRRHRTPRNLWRPFPPVARIWENFDSTQRVTVLRRKEQKKNNSKNLASTRNASKCTLFRRDFIMTNEIKSKGNTRPGQ